MSTSLTSSTAAQVDAIRRSPYTTVEPDHPQHHLTGESCRCQQGDDSWARNGTAMRVEWPRQPDARSPQPRRTRGRSR